MQRELHPGSGVQADTGGADGVLERALSDHVMEDFLQAA
jgi:hypothetical protein